MSPASSAHDYILSVHPRGDEQDEQDVYCHTMSQMHTSHWTGDIMTVQRTFT